MGTVNRLGDTNLPRRFHGDVDYYWPASVSRPGGDRVAPQVGMRHSRSLNPDSIANEPHAIQIVDTLKSL